METKLVLSEDVKVSARLESGELVIELRLNAKHEFQQFMDKFKDKLPLKWQGILGMVEAWLGSQP